MPRLYLIGGALAALVAAVIWLRADARSDLIEQQQSEAAQARLTHIETARQTDEDIRQTDNDALCAELYRRLSGADCDTAGGAVQ